MLCRDGDTPESGCCAGIGIHLRVLCCAGMGIKYPGFLSQTSVSSPCGVGDQDTAVPVSSVEKYCYYVLFEPCMAQRGLVCASPAILEISAQNSFPDWMN